MTYRYFTYPESIQEHLDQLRSCPPEVWEKKGKDKLIEFCNFVLQNVPAYQTFLKKSQVKVNSIHQMEEFYTLPLLNKGSYIKPFSGDTLIPRGFKTAISTFSSTSGSTGEPLYFPRSEEQDEQYEYIAELFLNNQFEIRKHKTLVIVGFSLGIWIGGIFTYKALNKLSQKGYALAVSPVGPNKDVFLKTWAKLGAYFDQIILMGYPFFIKEVLQTAAEENLPLSKHTVRIVMAAEGFSENFRQVIGKLSGIQNVYRDTLNIYGSVELGTMAHETPLTIWVRKCCEENPALFKTLYPNAHFLPTLAQYYPYLIHFETVENELVASGFGSLYPLLRYQLFDKGGIIPFNTMMTILQDFGYSPQTAFKEMGMDSTVFQLPFVYVLERSDLLLKVQGATIFPSLIHTALQKSDIAHLITSQFFIRKKENPELMEIMEVHIELKKGIQKQSIPTDSISTSILETLETHSQSSFHQVYKNGAIYPPEIYLHPYKTEPYFTHSIKHKWIQTA